MSKVLAIQIKLWSLSVVKGTASVGRSNMQLRQNIFLIRLSYLVLMIILLKSKMLHIFALKLYIKIFHILVIFHWGLE